LQRKVAHKAPRRYPAARRKRRKPEEITDRLIKAAGDAFRRYGFANATTAAIARKAGTTEALLYRYFGTKAELFRESVFKPLDRQLAELNTLDPKAAVAGDFRKSTRRYVSELQKFIGDHSEMLLSLFVARAYAANATHDVHRIDSLQTYFQHGAEMVSRMNRDKSPKINPDLMVRISFGAVLAVVVFKSMLFPRGLASDDEIRTAVTDFVLDGISADFPKLM